MGSPYIYFMEEINSIVETDYGDFMRKANSYLDKLKALPSAITSVEISKMLDQMQDYLQFNSNWDITTTKEKLLQDADKLIHLESQTST